MKKLIPAIGMTLLGAALLGTSTYAWFSANKTVTATGMNLQAKADSSLLISSVENGTYSNTTLLYNDVSGADGYLDPVKATFASESYSFMRLKSEAKALVNDSGEFTGEKGDDGYPTAAYLEESNKYYHDEVFLKFEASVAQGSEAPTQTVEFSGIMKSASSEQIFPAYRVALVVDGAVVGDPISFSQLYVKDPDGTEHGRVSGTATITLTANAPKKVEVYAWLDGKDSACKNSNAIKGDAFTVDLSFTIPSSSAE
ncbi:MAG: hypothetical protein KBS97_00305 [Firmicutes bacterium]|nr:hypothetical protein [Candidatus Fiminaster equi]